MNKLFVFFVLALLLLAPPVFSAGLVPCGGFPRCCDTGEPAGRAGCVVLNPNIDPPNCEPRCGICHFFDLLQNVINFLLFTIVPPVAVLFLVIAGALFIFGSGYDPALINQARSIIQSVAIGLIIVYGAWVFVNTFFVLIGLANTDLGNDIRNWFQIDCPISSAPLSHTFAQNPNQQPAAPNQPAAFLGVNPPLTGEEFPPPSF